MSSFPVIVDERIWSARVPSGCRELRLELDGATPISLGPVELRDNLDLGALHLSRAPAIAGRVVQSETERPLAGARVHVVHTDSLARALTAALHGQEPPFLGVTVSDERGWFRFADLPEVEARVLVTAPERAPAWTAGIQAQSGVERITPAVAVERQGSLSIFSTVVRDEPLRVVASVQLPESLLPEPLLSSALAAEAPARLVGLFSGEWLLELVTSQPTEGFAVLAREQVDLLPGEDRVVSFSDVDPPFRGRVTLGGEGLAARLRISPADRGGVVEVVHSDAEGRFQVWLEKAGARQPRGTPESRPRRRG